MGLSIFGSTDPTLEQDPWKLPSPLEESRNQWTTPSSDEDIGVNTGIGHNSRGHHIGENDDNDRYNMEQLGNALANSHLQDPLGLSNILSRSELIEDQILHNANIGSDPTGEENTVNVVPTTENTQLSYNEDDELNSNVWDTELTNTYDTLGFQNSFDKSFVRVKEIPEKEGLVFKHINYLVTHNIKFVGQLANNNNSDVRIIRRYSDFYWLYEVLIKKYPFRSIPELPPKKFNGSTTSSDSVFLQNRRRGLQRFLNLLVKHPILSKENLINMFLTVPNDFSNWKKFAKIDLADEFDGIKFSLPSKYRLKLQNVPREEFEESSEDISAGEYQDLIKHNNQLYKNIEHIWEENDLGKQDFVANYHKLSQNLGRVIDLWTKLTVLLERFERRELAMAMDEQRFELILKKFLETDDKIFQMDKLVEIHQNSPMYTFERDETQNLGIINSTIAKVCQYFQQKRQIQFQEVGGLSSTHLENFRKFLDLLILFNELLERLILYKVTTEKANLLIISKIMKANEKLQTWLKKPDIKGSDFDKLNNFINVQVSDLNRNLYKIILVKNCVKFEYKLFSKLKYLLSEIFQDWFADKSKYGESYNNMLEKCLAELLDLPLR